MNQPSTLPSIEMPWGAEVEEALVVAMGATDIYDFHALETLQCMVERRHGGETGVKSVQLLEGADVWRAGEDGRWSRRLLEAALSRSISFAPGLVFSAEPRFGHCLRINCGQPWSTQLDEDIHLLGWLAGEQLAGRL